MQKIINDLKFTSSSFLEFIVLKMLSGNRTFSPQEIHDELKRIGLKTPMGSIYPLLTQFRRKSYVISGHELNDNGFVIKTYCLTEKGKKHLIDFRRDWKRLNHLIASMGAR